MLFHATCIAIDDKGVLLAGPAGSGKSDLALRLIDFGAILVSDDQTELRRAGQDVLAAPPEAIAGLFEVRHVGLMRMPYRTDVRIALYIDLTASHAERERLPEQRTILLLDYAVPRLSLPSFAASTPAKIKAFLNYTCVTDQHDHARQL